MLKVFSLDPFLPCPAPCSLLRYFSFQLFSFPEWLGVLPAAFGLLFQRFSVSLRAVELYEPEAVFQPFATARVVPLSVVM